MQPWQHAKLSANKFGGDWKDYLAFHEFVDSAKVACPDLRHRIVLHNFDLGLALAKLRFPGVPNLGDLLSAHIQQDLKSTPTLEDWLSTAQKPSRIHARQVDTGALISQATETVGLSDSRPVTDVFQLLNMGEQFCSKNTDYSKLILMNSFGPSLVRQIMGPAYMSDGQIFDPSWVAEGIIVAFFGRIPTLTEVLTPFSGKLS